MPTTRIHDFRRRAHGFTRALFDYRDDVIRHPRWSHHIARRSFDIDGAIVANVEEPKAAYGRRELPSRSAIVAMTLLVGNSSPLVAQLSASGTFNGSAALRGVSASTTITAGVAGGPSASAAIAPDSSRTVLFDSFTGADGTPATGHTPDIASAGGTWTVTSSVPVRLQGGALAVANQETSDGSARARVTIDSAIANGVITADWQPAATGTAYGYPIGGVIFRAQDASNYWVAGWGFASYPLALWKVTNGNWALVTSASVGSPVGARHLIEVHLDNAAIEVWWDGVRRLQASDAFGLTAAVHGLCWSTYGDWRSTFDNFSVQTPTTAAIDRVTITPSAPLVAIGDAQLLTAQAYDATNHPIANAIFHWTISDPAAGTLSTAGYYASTALVRGLSGNVVVTATPVAGPPASVPITVDPNVGLYVLDRFSGADNTALTAHTPDVSAASARWTTFGSPGSVLRGQQLVPNGQDTSTFLSGASIDAGTADAVVGVDWMPNNPNGSPIGALMLRVRDSSNYFIAGYNVCGYAFALCRVEVGNISVLGSATPTLTGFVHRLEVKLSGPAITVSSDGVPLITASDSHFISATRHGVRWWTPYDSTSMLDNFSVKALPAPAVSRVVVSPASPTVSNGGTQTFTAQAYDAANQPIPNTPFHWTAAGPASRLVSAAYYATNASVWGITGAATVTATPISGASGSTSIAVDASRQMLYDSFSGADGTALTAHVPEAALAGGRWTVTSGYAQANLRGQTLGQGLQDTSCGCPLVATIDAGASDAIVGVDWNAAGSGTASGYPIGGLVFRAQDAANYWVAGPGFASYGLSLWKVTNGNWARVTGSTVAVVPGVPHRVEVRLQGSAIEVWYDGAREIVANDAFLASATRHGVATSPTLDWLSTFDNFSVEAAATAHITRVVVSPTAATVTTGGSTWLTAQAYDAANHPVPALFRWSVSDPTAGTVSTTSYYASAAVVRGITGAVTVTATPIVGAIGTATVGVDSSHTLLFDSFTGADDTLLTAHAPNVHAVSGAWTIGGSTSAVLRANRVAPRHQTAATEFIRATIETGAVDGTIAADFHAAPASGTAAGYPVGGIVFRARDAANFWVAGPGYGSWPLSLWKVQNSNWVLEGSVNTPTLAGATGRLEVRLAGPTIEVWWDGVRQLQYADLFGIDQTQHGLLWSSYWDWSTAFDNLALEGTLRCVNPLSPAVVSVPYQATSGTLSVSAASGCAWSAATDAAWVAWTTATTGTGSESLSYSVAANPSPIARTATLVVGGRLVSLVQAPGPQTCTFDTSPVRWVAPGSGGTFSVSVRQIGGCAWSAAMDLPAASWMQVAGNSGGTAIDGTVTYTLAPNRDLTQRSAVIHINAGSPAAGSADYVVIQDGAGGSGGAPTAWPSGCFNGVFPAGATFSADATQAEITVSAPDGCEWSVASDASWVTPAGGSGIGSAMLAYRVAANPTNVSRTATLTVGGQPFAISQAESATGIGTGSGGGCPATLSPPAATFGPAGGTATLKIAAHAGCAWSVSSNVAWIAAGGGGTGEGIFQYSIAPNASGQTRSGRVFVGDVAIDVVQVATTDEQPVLFVHGWNADSSTWEPAVSHLQQRLAIQAFKSDTASTSTYENQALTLSATFGSLPSSTIAVGHSNGGVLSREWSKSHALKGIVTIGTPHRGMPLVTHVADISFFVNEAASLMADIERILGAPNRQEWWSLLAIIEAQAFGAIRQASIHLLTNAVKLVPSAGAVTPETNPSSSYLAGLNSAQNLARESTSVPFRIGIVNTTKNYRTDGPFRLFLPDPLADGFTVSLRVAGGLLSLQGGSLLNEVNSLPLNDPKRYEASDVNDKLQQLVRWLARIGPLWCAWVSSVAPVNVFNPLDSQCVANDGFVPEGSQVYPTGMTVRVENGPPHTREKQESDEVFYHVLNSYLNVPPRGSSVPEPPSTISAQNSLQPGDKLNPGDSRTSSNGRYELYYQGDGNLVLYSRTTPDVWQSRTNTNDPGFAVMRTDGNLVVYNSAAEIRFESGTGVSGTYLVVTDDGRIVLYSPGGDEVWWRRVGQ